VKYLLAAAALLPIAALAMQRRELAAVEPDSPDVPPDQLPEPGFLESIGIAILAVTRGERNNNPGNLRKSPAQWQGKIAGSDSAFETFADPRDGIRALAKLLRNYQVNYGLKTVRGIIARYAPARENDTAAYVRSVAQEMKVGADQPIDLTDNDTLAALVAAIIRHENGRVIYAAADIQTAVRNAA